MTKQSTEELVTLGDVYNEFNAYVPHTTRMKKVTKNFAFNVPGVQVPPTCEYMQVITFKKFEMTNIFFK